MWHSIYQILRVLICITILYSFAPAKSDSKKLNIEILSKGLTCIKDPTDDESSNSFLLQGENADILIDAGWSDEAEVPEDLVSIIEKSQKVATHFHFDHIRQWHKMNNIFLTTNQLTACEKDLCSPSRWQTIMKVKPFRMSGRISNGLPIANSNPRLISIACNGHSPSDVCYLDTQTRSLFVGDLFYLGPVFYFLPGSSIQSAADSLDALLKRNDWDQIALSHGACVTNRAKALQYLDDLRKIISGELSWVLNFDFWIPLRAYKVHSGYVLTNLIL